MADDTTVFVDGLISLQRVLGILYIFKMAAGLKLNKNKTEILNIGKRYVETRSPYGLQWDKDRVFALGVWYCINSELSEKLNFEERLLKMKKLLNMWSQRDLSLKGRVTILKTYAVPQLLYVCGNLGVPEWFTKGANTAMFNFLWSGKNDKIKRKTIVAPIEEGGLKMIDLEAMIKAQKVMWVKRLLDENFASWKAFPYWLFGHIHPRDFFKCSYSKEKLPFNLTLFYHQIAYAWSEFISLSEINDQDINTVWQIRRQYIWYNKHILIGNNYAGNNYKKWYTSGIKLIHDIVNEKGLFYTAIELNEKYGIQVDIMKYNSLKDAVPQSWRKTLKTITVQRSAINSMESICVYVNKTELPITFIRNKDVYLSVLKPTLAPPICREKWSKLFPDCSLDWKKIFCLSFNTIRDSKLQSLQYKILYNIYPCNWYVSKWNHEISPLCNICKKPDTLIHFFAECDLVKPFWRSLNNWWNNIFEDELKISCKDILLGRLEETKHIIII